MWTGNKPPRLPKTSTTTAASPPSKAKSSKANAELEALRQRGLTTLLNRHFTEATRQVAAEKAAADAALSELEARKAAQPKHSVAGKTGELSPLDALYVSVNQWRADCRRKERETVMMYQRYVHKFGDSGQVQLPSAPEKGIPDWAKNESTPNAKENTRNAVSHSQQQQAVVAAMKKQIEQKINEYLEKGGLEMPSMESLGKDQTFQQVFQKHQAEFQNYHLRQLEKRGVDASATVPKSAEKDAYLGPGAFSDAQAAFGGDPLLRTIEGVSRKPAPSTPGLEDENVKLTIDGGSIDFFQDEHGFSHPVFVQDSDDMRSIVSGLTSLNSAETRRVLQDCEQSVATFLQQEHKAIREMMALDENDDSYTGLTRVSSDADSVMNESIRAVDEAEHMVMKMKDILDTFNKKAGGKLDPNLDGAKNTSLGTEETEEEDFDDEVTIKARPFKTDNPNEDWVICYDPVYKRDYYHERNTNRTQWQSPDRDSTSQSSVDGDLASVYTYDQVKPELSGRVGTSRYARYRRQRRKARRRRRILVVLALLLLAVFVCMVMYPSVGSAIVALPLAQTSPAAILALPHLAQMTSQGAAIYHVYYLGEHQDQVATTQALAQRRLEEIVYGWYGLPAPSSPKASSVKQEETAPVPNKPASRNPFIEVMEAVAPVADEKPVVKEVLDEQETQAVSVEYDAWACNVPMAYLTPACRKHTAALSDIRIGQAFMTLWKLFTAKEPTFDNTVVVKRPFVCHLPLIYLVSRVCRNLADQKPLFDLPGLVGNMMQ